MEARPWHAHYPPKVPKAIDFEDVPLARFLPRTAARVPEATALSFLGTRLTYAQLEADVDRLAGALVRLGVAKHTRVAIHLPTLPQAVIAFQAAMACGAEVVMTNPLYTERELEHQWKDAGIELAFTADFLWTGRLRAMRASLPVREYVVASIPEYLRFPLNLLAPLKLKKQRPPLWAKFDEEPHVHRFKRLVRSSPRARPDVAVDMDDLALLQYTGGTTGLSKGAMLTHRNLAANVQQLQAWFQGIQYGKEVILTALPLFHVFGLTVCMEFGVWYGAELALVPNPRDTKAIVDTIEKRRVTIFPGAPAMFNALNHYPGIDGRDVRSVKACFSGSAPIAPDVLERFEKLTGARILEGFGLSESSPVTHCNPIVGTRKIGTVGLPVSDTDARVVDVDDPERELGVGEEGELLIRGPQVMQGYWNQPDESAKSLEGGWLHTGDLASIDPDGYFKIVGRKKDMINCNGLKVFPDEVDAVLMAHPGIREAATIGVPDPERIETVKSFVVLQPGTQLTPEAIQEFARKELAPYKIPRQIEFLDELPKSNVLKVLRRELRQREIDKRAQSS